jgi:hypothetical protein
MSHEKWEGSSRQLRGVAMDVKNGGVWDSRVAGASPVGDLGLSLTVLS